MRDVGGGFAFARFWSGAKFAASGVSFTLGHSKLLAISLIPMVVQATLFILFVVGGVMSVGGLVDHIRPEEGHWYSFVGGVLYVMAIILVVLASVILSLFLGGVVCDPFYDTLSERTESILIGRDVGTPFTVPTVIAGIMRELLASMVRISVYALVAVPLWVISLSGVGSIIALPLSLAWTWMFVALAGYSRQMTRHAIPGGSRISALFKMPSVALGFGAVGWVMSYVPLTYPFLVVGGTRLYLALAAYDRVPSTLTADDKRALVATTE